MAVLPFVGVDTDSKIGYGHISKQVDERVTPMRYRWHCRSYEYNRLDFATEKNTRVIRWSMLPH
jgi:hypothetical protein